MFEPGIARKALGGAAALLVVLASTGTGLAQDAPPDAAGVTIDNFRFAPAEVWVVAGGSVAWTNNQAGTPHTITSADDVWDSEPVDPSGTFTMAFPDLGDFAYACSIHPAMQGVVHVVSDASQIPAVADSGLSATPAAPPPAAITAPAPTAGSAPPATAAPTVSVSAPTATSLPAPAATPRPTSPPSPPSYRY